MRLIHCTDVFPLAGKEFIPPDAMYRGRWVHLGCHIADTGGQRDASTVYPPWEGFLDAWSAAKRDLGITVLGSEEPVTDEQRGYCGTRDKRVTMTGRRGEGVLDLKCDNSCSGKIPDTTGLQTAGYVGESKMWRAAVALHPDGTYRYHDDRNNTDVFKPGDWREFCQRLFVFHADIARGWREMPPEREE